MKLTAEQIAKMKAATSAGELIALAKAEGIEATEEEIKAQFNAMHKEGEIADEELDNVAGGDCLGDYTPMYCKSCGWATTWEGKHDTILPYKGPCPECGAEYIYAAGEYVPPLF